MEFGVGSIVDGKVTGITKFGAFIALPEGKSGLVHISEIAYSYVNEVSDFLTEGQDVTVKVIGIDDANRINLSIKKAQAPPPRPAGRPMGSPRPAPSGDNRTGSFHPAGGSPRPAGAGGRSGGGGYRSGNSYMPRQTAPKEPADFEDRLKQFMQSSDSKLSEMRYLEKKGSSRRGGGHSK